MGCETDGRMRSIDGVRAWEIALIGCVGVAVGACNQNQSGHLRAVEHGDRAARPIERGSPVAEVREACGAEGQVLAEEEARIGRAPYLQQVTPTSAVVGWVGISPGQRVRIRRAGVDGVSEVPARVEATAHPPVRGQQMWAPVQGLEPDTTYCYEIVDGDRPVTQAIGFRTAPEPSTTRPVRFIAFGDSGHGGSDQYALRRQMDGLPFELMLHTGDLAYEEGTLAQIEATVFAPYASLLRHIPLFPIPGGHDYETDSGAPYREVFALPGESGERWYSFDWGPVHFVALDAETRLGGQSAWLERDLAATRQPWRIVYVHRPLYSSGKHGSDRVLRRELEPILVRHGVQLVLSGHEHDYERSRPMHGIVHVVTGGGGRGVRRVTGAAFTAFAQAVIHLVHVEVTREELVLRAIDATGTEFDAVTLRNGRAERRRP